MPFPVVRQVGGHHAAAPSPARPLAGVWRPRSGCCTHSYGFSDGSMGAWKGAREMGRGRSHTSLAEELVTPSCTGHASGTCRPRFRNFKHPLGRLPRAYHPGEGEAGEAEALVKGHQWGQQ